MLHRTGTYQASAASHNCVSCPGGTYLSDAATDAALHASLSYCEPCPAGSFSTAGVAGGSPAPGSCTLCPAGTYSAAVGATSCETCGAGTYAAAAGSTSCLSCPAGTFLQDHDEAAMHDEAEDCEPCAEDTFCALPGGCDACAACPEDEYASAGSDACFTCAEGASSDDCIVCEPGTYDTDDSGCVDCPVCTYSEVSGATECAPCPAGHYADEPGSRRCEPAGAGFYATDTSLDMDGVGVDEGACSAVACPTGTWSPSGASSCVAAFPGYFASDSPTDADGVGVTSGATAEAPCPAATSSEEGAYRCAACDLGAYAPAGSAACSSCPAGTYGSEASGTAACSGPCDAGRVGGDGALMSACHAACPAGYYCPVGTADGDELECGSVDVYCPAGSGKPKPVDAGAYTTGGASETTREAQETCPMGSYCSGDGLATACPGGTYGADVGLSSAACSGACAEGYFCAPGSTSPTAALCGAYIDPPAAAYCPAGAAAPTPAAEGEYTTPRWGSAYARTAVASCAVDADGLYAEYCPGDGSRFADLVSLDCPATLDLPEKRTAWDAGTTLVAASRVDGAAATAWTLATFDFPRFAAFVNTFEDDSPDAFGDGYEGPGGVGSSAYARNGMYSWAMDGDSLSSSAFGLDLGGGDGVTVAFWLRPDGWGDRKSVV